MLNIEKLIEALENELGANQFLVTKNKAGNRAVRPHPKTVWKKLNGGRLKSLPYTQPEDTTIRRAYRRYVLAFSYIEKDVIKGVLDQETTLVSRIGESKTALSIQVKDSEATASTRYQEPRARKARAKGRRIPDHTPKALEKAIELDPTLKDKFEEAFKAGKVSEATTILTDGFRTLYRENPDWFRESLAA